MPDLGNTSVFSQTDGSNNSGTQPSWSGSAAPSTLDDAGRGLQGAVFREWNWRNYTLTAAGTADAKTLTYSVAPAAYYNGQRFTFIANTTNTGTATLNVNSLGAVTIKKDVSGTLTALSASDMVAGMFVEVAYNSAGTCFVWVNRGAAVGTAAQYDIGTSGAKVPLLNGANTWSGQQSYSMSGNYTVFSETGTTYPMTFRGFSGATDVYSLRENGGNRVGFNFDCGNQKLEVYTANTLRLSVTSAGGVSFGSGGTSYGTTGQVLTSAGNAPPTWGSVGSTALGTLTTTSGTSQSLTSLTLTGYKFLRLVFNGVSAGASGNLSVGSLVLGAWNNTTNIVTGFMDIDLTNGVGHAYATNVTGPLNNASSGATGYSTATTTLTVTSGTTFDAGSVLVYGIA